jgi:dihydroxyacetone kinase
LIADYSITDAIMLNKLINNTPFASIKYACEVAKKYGVREIRYINAIIDRERAKQEERTRSISALSDRISQSDKLTQTQTHRHTIMDIALAQYNYEKAKQNADIERKFKEMFGDG